MNEIQVESLGDCALLLRFGTRIDPALNANVHVACAALRAAGLRGLRDIVPAYASITLHYDPRVWFGSDPAVSTISKITKQLIEIIEYYSEQKSTQAQPTIEIPVCYGGEFGPDLGHVAQLAKLDQNEVIARHTAGEYHVAMLGFAPGFPYLLGLDPALHTPRRAEPRVRVAAGSVAIGGAQTGIYPSELPGGWQIVGRTALALFDVAREPPALLAPGQRVRFRAVGADELMTFVRQ